MTEFFGMVALLAQGALCYGGDGTRASLDGIFVCPSVFLVVFCTGGGGGFFERLALAESFAFERVVVIAIVVVVVAVVGDA